MGRGEALGWLGWATPRDGLGWCRWAVGLPERVLGWIDYHQLLRLMSIKKTWLRFIAGVVLAVIVIVALCFMVTCLGEALHDPKRGPGSSDAAGWTQAIAAFLTLLAAFLVFVLQIDAQDRTEQKRNDIESRGVLQSIKSELEALFDNTKQNLGKQIAALEPGNGLFTLFPITNEPFKIYNALIPKLGIIPDEALRTKVVKCYATAESFVATVQHNNLLVQEHRRAESIVRLIGTPQHQRELHISVSTVNRYGDELREFYKSAMRETEELLAALNQRLS